MSKTTKRSRHEEPDHDVMKRLFTVADMIIHSDSYQRFITRDEKHDNPKLVYRETHDPGNEGEHHGET